MSGVVGGLRARLVRESLYRMIHTSLTSLDWFNTVNRKHLPVTFNSDPVKDVNSVPLNTAALTDFDSDDDESEMGSLMTEITWRFYVDIFAESEALGLHFARDVRDILQGRMASIGRTTPDFAVYDYQQATPPVLFYCQIEGVKVDRPENFTKPYDRFWYTVRFDIKDTYTDESG
jgi:hypothetical protein